MMLPRGGASVTLAVEVGQRPWDQLPGESDKAFAGFVIFREMPRSDRALTAASRAIYGSSRGTGLTRGGQPLGRVQEWHDTNNWRDRVRAYDREQDRIAEQIKADATRTEIESMAKRQAQQAQAYQTILVQPTLTALRRLALPLENPQSLAAALAGMTAFELLKMAAETSGPFANMVKLERLARGMSTENVDQHTKVSGGDDDGSGGDGRFVGAAVTDDDSLSDQHFTEVIAILLEAGVLKADPAKGVIDAQANEVHSPQADIKANGVSPTPMP